MAQNGEPSGRQSRLSTITGPSTPELLDWTFNHVLRNACLHHPNRTAVISQHQDESYSYLELQTRSNRLAFGLHSLGVRKGDRVGVLLGNRSEYVDTMFACSQLGAYFTLFNYAYSSTELVNALTATTPKILLTSLGTSRYDYSAVLASLRDAAIPKKIIILNDLSNPSVSKTVVHPFVRYEDVISRRGWSSEDMLALENGVLPSDILNLQFTSGSTGLPKAAALTHHGMVNSARYIGDEMNVTEKDRINVPVPLFHAFGLIMGLCNAAVHGASIVLPSEYFDASATLHAVERYKCTGLYGVTTMFVDELSHPGFSRIDRSSLRFGMMAGSAMPEELLIRVMTRFPIAELYTNWGMTELSSVATMTTASDPIGKKMRTAGRLLPNFTGKIVEPYTSRVLPWGQRGEIVIHGFGVMHSYYNDSERTAVVLRHHEDREVHGHPRKWMHTGDEGYLDQDGYFVITGRIKDLIIRGGENISPLEIEARLFEHPAIKQAAVFGVPSRRYGEEVAAMLEFDESYTGTSPSDTDIKIWIRKDLSRYKTPRYIWWLGDAVLGVPNEWPKTANGKLRKGDIRKIGEELLRNAPADAGLEIKASL